MCATVERHREVNMFICCSVNRFSLVCVRERERDKVQAECLHEWKYMSSPHESTLSHQLHGLLNSTGTFDMSNIYPAYCSLCSMPICTAGCPSADMGKRINTHCMHSTDSPHDVYEWKQISTVVKEYSEQMWFSMPSHILKLRLLKNKHMAG